MEYVSIVISIITVLILLYNFAKSNKKDVIEENNETNSIKESLLKANIKLDQVCSTTNETRTDIKSMQMKINDMDKEVTIIKRDLATAFVRIDELKDSSRGR